MGIGHGFCGVRVRVYHFDPNKTRDPHRRVRVLHGFCRATYQNKLSTPTSIYSDIMAPTSTEKRNKSKASKPSNKKAKAAVIGTKPGPIVPKRCSHDNNVSENESVIDIDGDAVMSDVNEENDEDERGTYLPLSFITEIDPCTQSGLQKNGTAPSMPSLTRFLKLNMLITAVATLSDATPSSAKERQDLFGVSLTKPTPSRLAICANMLRLVGQLR
jgi:hypothetical protein